MRRCVVWTVLFCLLGQLALPAVALAAERQVRVTASALNIRSGPSSDQAVVGRAFIRELLEFIEQDGEWMKVRLKDGTVGWASSKYLEIVDKSKDEEKPRTEEKREEPKREISTKQDPERTTHHEESGGGGSGFGTFLKWTCFAGALATGALAFSEHSAGNDSYDDYKRFVGEGDTEKADAAFEDAEDHDSKAQTFGIAAGALFGVFLLQQFVLGGGDDDGAERLTPNEPTPLALDPRTGEIRASFVLARF